MGSSHPNVIRSYNAPKVRFSATLGQEAEVELALVERLGASVPLTDAPGMALSATVPLAHPAAQVDCNLPNVTSEHKSRSDTGGKQSPLLAP